MGWTRKPPEERATCSITLPLTQGVFDNLEAEASRRGVTRTALARALLSEALEAAINVRFGAEAIERSAAS